MTMNLTPSQLAFHQAAKERATRKILAVRYNECRNTKNALHGAHDEDVCVSSQEYPLWMMFSVKFDQHVIAFHLRNAKIYGSPLKSYIQKRAIELGFDYESVVGHRRKRALVDARQLIMWEIKTIVKPEISYPELGRLFGGRDHSTAHHSVHKVAAQKANDEAKR